MGTTAVHDARVGTVVDAVMVHSPTTTAEVNITPTYPNRLPVRFKLTVALTAEVMGPQAGVMRPHILVTPASSAMWTQLMDEFQRDI